MKEHSLKFGISIRNNRYFYQFMKSLKLLLGLYSEKIFILHLFCSLAASTVMSYSLNGIIFKKNIHLVFFKEFFIIYNSLKRFINSVYLYFQYLLLIAVCNISCIALTFGQCLKMASFKAKRARWEDSDYVVTPDVDSEHENSSSGEETDNSSSSDVSSTNPRMQCDGSYFLAHGPNKVML